MCGFVGYLGWFEMSVAEQWEIGLKLIGVGIALSIAIWSVVSWRLAKIIEIEEKIIEYASQSQAYWTHIMQFTDDEELIELASKQVSSHKSVRAELNKKHIGLRKLRKLNRSYRAKVTYSDYRHKLLKDGQLTRESLKKPSD